MFSLLALYLCIPRRFRFIARWLAMCIFVVVVALVIALFAQTLIALHRNHGHWLLHPRTHQPMSPDSIVYRPQHHHYEEMGQ
jgi:hypothetical protein